MLPEQVKSKSAASVCIRIILIGVIIAIIAVFLFGVTLTPEDMIILFLLVFSLVTFFGCCYGAATGGDLVTDVTLASFKMVIVPTERDNVYLTKYALPQQCFQCGADLSTKFLELVDNLTVTCPSCKKEIPCEGKFDSMPME
ncbi:MAG: hypothetical protein GF411_19220 [Candidatus Lokiarchaeota archaeon]|nr:hypothetical protein [Candidatus Lokiarchaeota archaeon]